MRNLNTTVTTTAHQHSHQQHQTQIIEHSADKHHLQNEEQFSGGGGVGSGSGQHMVVDIISLPTSVINRSFDNVSPRPYISIEGMFCNSCNRINISTEKVYPNVTQCALMKN